MICGEGLIDGSYEDEYGYTRYALSGEDPEGGLYRNEMDIMGHGMVTRGLPLLTVGMLCSRIFDSGRRTFCHYL